MKDKVIEELKKVYDPEMPSIDVFNLGLIYDIDIKDKDVTITHTPPFTREMLSEEAKLILNL